MSRAAKRAQELPAPDGWRSRIVGEDEVAPDQLLAHPANARRHPNAQRDALDASLDTLGWIQRIVVNQRTGHVIDGHARVEQALGRAEATVPVVYVDLSDEEERLALAIYDPISALAVYDPDALRDLLASVTVDSAALQGVMAGLPKTSKPGLTDPDNIPEERPTEVKRGDIYLLGKHRLMCGDSTSAEDVARLMDGETVDLCFTSPPYNAGEYRLTGNVKMKDKSSRYDGRLDELSEDSYLRFLIDFTSIALTNCRTVAINLQQLAGNKVAVLKWAGHFAEHFVDRSVWYKGHGNPAMAPNVMAARFEDIWIWSPEARPSRAIQTASFRGTVENVVESVGASSENDQPSTHAATMPVVVATYAIRSWSVDGSTVYEPFSGSGTTIIAAEKQDRTCYAMEIEPKYVQVAIDRWEAFTGETAARAS